MTYEEVRRFEIFEGLSDDRLRVLVDASEEVFFDAGHPLWSEREPADTWWVLLEGQVDLVRHVGRERVLLGVLDQPGRWGEGWMAFDPHGVCMVTGLPTTDGRVMRVPVAALRALIHDVPLVRHLVDGLFQTARHIEAATRQREALVALGTLAAGLAHELNNPAAAAARSVDTLRGTMRDAAAALRALAGEGITSSQLAALEALRGQAIPSGTAADALAVADREQALADWMGQHGVERDWVLAPALAAASFEPAWCDRVLATMGQPALQPALDWVASSVAAELLLSEVGEAAGRISELVASVRSYSQMDRGSLQRIDVTEGLESTLAVLAHKLKGGVEVVRAYGPDVPRIDAFAGDLNQVWTNLIDNAIDAMDGHGTLTLTASAEGGRVVVLVADSGAGMTSEVAERAFDTFFTTKGVGQGTGLGLDIARRIVVRHGGDISVESEPGRTVFRVVLPVRQSGPTTSN